MTVVFQSQEDAIFLCRRYASENAGAFSCVLQRRLSQLFQIITGYDLTRIDPYLRANMSGDAIVVSRNDLCLHPVPFQRCERLGGISERFIREAQKASENQVLLVSNGITCSRWYVGVSDRQQAKALAAEFVSVGLYARPGIVVDGYDLSFELVR